MKKLKTYLVLLTSCLICIPISQADQSGLSFSAGLGMSPIYIEEQIEEDHLSGGLTVSTFYSQVSSGYSFSDQIRFSLMASHNWYVDTESSIVATGLLGLGGTYSPAGSHNTYLKGGVGWATKNIFSTSEMATGIGYLLGFGQSFSERISLEISLQSLVLQDVLNDSGDSIPEDISSVQLSLVFITF